MTTVNRNDPYAAIPQLEAIITGTQKEVQKTGRANKLLEDMLNADREKLEDTWKSLDELQSTLPDLDIEAIVDALYGDEVYLQAVDDEGNPKYDEFGDPVYVQATDENGEPLFDDEGNPVYETVRVGGVINDLAELDEETKGYVEQILDDLQFKEQTIEDLITKQEELEAMDEQVDTLDYIIHQWGLNWEQGEDGLYHPTINGQAIEEKSITAKQILAESITLTELSSKTVEDLKEYLNYIRMDAETGSIIIGSSGSPFWIEITNEGIDLYADNVKVAYFKNDAMLIEKARIINSIKFGAEGDQISDFAFIPQANGNLSFMKVEDVQ